jgi:hypothetical protein
VPGAPMVALPAMPVPPVGFPETGIVWLKTKSNDNPEAGAMVRRLKYPPIFPKAGVRIGEVQIVIRLNDTKG